MQKKEKVWFFKIRHFLGNFWSRLLCFIPTKCIALPPQISDLAPPTQLTVTIHMSLPPQLSSNIHLAPPLLALPSGTMHLASPLQLSEAIHWPSLLKLYTWSHPLRSLTLCTTHYGPTSHSYSARLECLALWSKVLALHTFQLWEFSVRMLCKFVFF